jgi:hypothetical protein
MVFEMPPNAIVLRWTPERADMQELTARPAFRRQMAKSMLVATALLAGGLVLMVTGAASEAGGIAAVAGGTLLLLLGFAPRRALQLRWNNDPLSRDPVEYVVSERGLSRRQQDFECWWGWPRVYDVEESSGAFILRLGVGRSSDGPILILAKRGLAGPADETRLRELLDVRVRRRPLEAS